MQYSERQLRNLTVEYLQSQAHRRLAHHLGTVWSHEAHGPRRYAKVYEDASLTLWLLGWRPGVDTVDHHVDVTPIHGHGASAGLITCLRGEVEESGYGIIPIALDDAPEDDIRRKSFTSDFKRSICGVGHSIYLPAGRVHEMCCGGRGFSLTLHAYSPRLSLMTYFAPDNQPSGDETSPRLSYIARWIDTGERLVS